MVSWGRGGRRWCGFVACQYLWVNIEDFDSLGGDEEIHLCHGLRFTFRGLNIHKYTTLTHLCHMRENVQVQDRDEEVFSNTPFFIQTKEITCSLHYYIHIFIYLATVCIMLRLCRHSTKENKYQQHQLVFWFFSFFFEVSFSTLQSAYSDSWLHSAYIRKVDTTCEDTLLHMPSYTVNICKSTNLKSITLSLVSVLNKNPPKGST